MAVARSVAGVLVIALAGCGDATTVIQPIIDTPIADDTDAIASGLDSITLSVGHDGEAEDLDAHNFTRGQALELPGVPFDSHLVIHMEGFTGNATVAYGRTCAMSVVANAPPPKPHLFFSRTVKFASVDIPLVERRGGLGISLAGSAVFAGGMATGSVTVGGPDVPVTMLERYDPATTNVLALGLPPHANGAIALLGTTPQVVVLGGTGSDASAVDFLDGDTVSRAPFPGAGRSFLTATSLVDGRVLVVGGQDDKAGPAAMPSGEIDVIDDQHVVRAFQVSLLTPRSHHTATRFGNDDGAPVLIVGGKDGNGQPIATAELFKPLSDSLASTTTFNHRLVTARYDHLAVLLPDESVLVIGGVDRSGNTVRTLERFTIDASFFPVADLPADAGLIDAVATPLPDGRILLTGGRTTVGGPPVNSVYIIRFDPNDGEIEIIATDHLAFARAGHQAAVLCDGTVLINGGTPFASKPERYNPPPAGRR
ncbi:MAG TPA: hypothetical protein VFP84_21755 [Kofleriaceae bacterium]|nr:hypothetical protein [Kofleriaceae bacterium]